MKPKKTFKIVGLALQISVALVSMGIAYAGGIRGIGLLGVCFSMTFGIAVVLAQLVPAGILLSCFIGTALSPFRRSGVPIRAR